MFNFFKIVSSNAREAHIIDGVNCTVIKHAGESDVTLQDLSWVMTSGELGQSSLHIDLFDFARLDNLLALFHH